MSVSDIKAILKSYNMSQAGDKGTLLHRIRLKEKCGSLGLQGEGINISTTNIEFTNRNCR